MHTSLTFELHSIEDDVQLYEGDPQYLMQLEVRPLRSLLPKVEFTIANQVATVRVRDLALFEQPPEPVTSETDPDLLDTDRPERPPVAQDWIVQLLPAAATEFVLQCEGGQGDFDFTDLPVHSVHLLADTTRIRMEWKRPNLVPLERLKITVRSGTVTLRGLLDARPRLATLQIDDSKCEIDFTGTPFAGEGEIFLEGVPRQLRITLARHVALHLEGPSTTITAFDRHDLVRRDLALETAEYATQPCRVRLHFSQPVPKLEVRWED